MNHFLKFAGLLAIPSMVSRPVYVSLFCGALLLVALPGCHNNGSAAINRLTMVSPAGHHIYSFFDGLPVDKRFVRRNFYAEGDRRIQNCKTAKDRNRILDWLGALLSPITVQAQTSCGNCFQRGLTNYCPGCMPNRYQDVDSGGACKVGGIVAYIPACGACMVDHSQLCIDEQSTCCYF